MSNVYLYLYIYLLIMQEIALYKDFVEYVSCKFYLPYNGILLFKYLLYYDTVRLFEYSFLFSYVSEVVWKNYYRFDYLILLTTYHYVQSPQ
jgi:hypothetical protein